jgi:putative FmdB family regulatory protein
MPTYEYECKKCNHRFEVFQSMSDEPIKKCPECGKQVRRLVSGGVGVIFKGSGFYATDKDKAAVPKGDSKKDSATKVDAPKTDIASKGSDTTEAGSKEVSKADASSSPKGDAPKGDAPKEDGDLKSKGKTKPAA